MEDTSDNVSNTGNTSNNGNASSEEQSRPIREEKQSVQGYIAIKGTRNGLLLTLEPETPFHELLSALAERLAEAPSFFRGASLSVDTSRRMLRVSERVQLEKLLAHYQMSVTPLELIPSTRKESTHDLLAPTQPLIPSPETNPASEAISTQREATETRETRDARESTDTLFLRRTVRSGQAIHHTSTVVVLGDVNPGAEIVAGGDIIVWGVLRGMVHAGYPDNEQALVCALQLSPVQLRVAHLLSRPPEGMDAQQLPEVAAIRNGRIVVETWFNGRAPRK
ncbi:MAG TPA: septum site-determining protein MinC [Ktedonobacteraceae bacterium]|nr:septum site-determining protein MinC [Ktedonobacteraceae bacterium]